MMGTFPAPRKRRLEWELLEWNGPPRPEHRPILDQRVRVYLTGAEVEYDAERDEGIGSVSIAVYVNDHLAGEGSLSKATTNVRKEQE